MTRKRFYLVLKRFATKLSTAHPGVIHLFVELTEVGRHNNVYTVQWDERSGKPTLLDKVDDASVEFRELVDRLFPGDIPWR